MRAALCLCASLVWFQLSHTGLSTHLYPVPITSCHMWGWYWKLVLQIASKLLSFSWWTFQHLSITVALVSRDRLLGISTIPNSYFRKKFYPVYGHWRAGRSLPSTFVKFFQLLRKPREASCFLSLDENYVMCSPDCSWESSCTHKGN